MAAKRGVDVRIVTPGIPDKKAVFRLTRANYLPLLKAGIKIYEYTPGFIHAKSFVSDDTVGVVGTINLDYRSLYFHFENAVFLYDCEAVQDIWRDFAYTFKECREVTADYNKKRKPFLRLGQCMLRLIAPML
jgi:cardiolipin synthase